MKFSKGRKRPHTDHWSSMIELATQKKYFSKFSNLMYSNVLWQRKAFIEMDACNITRLACQIHIKCNKVCSRVRQYNMCQGSTKTRLKFLRGRKRPHTEHWTSNAIKYFSKFSNLMYSSGLWRRKAFIEMDACNITSLTCHIQLQFCKRSLQA